MKIGIIGATGKLGKLLLKEAIDRGHEVTPIIRDANKLDYSTKNLIEKSINELTTEDINSFDNVISAFGVPMGNGEIHISISKKLINIFEGTNIRLLIVGGAGSLYIDNNSKKKLIDTGDLPNDVQKTAEGQNISLQLLRESDVNWSYFSPSANFDKDGLKTGNYKFGNNVLLKNNLGKSYLSYSHAALAILDEIEKPNYVKKQFTVISE
ncbi:MULTISPECIES: NAD(P)-dependent oxidoreductase [Staphylococcus]|uniref:NAD(P)-dependent oxidoreductase n=1 Tax=Staphylococcus TaxID=1279 RepID=UPI00187A1202|nr:NAD(P)H-binding protein [Staphylococcus haemolyticus]MBE7342019.1 NAD(P)H-binding protein [Staphylococcus haemolyticus]